METAVKTPAKPRAPKAKTTVAKIDKIDKGFEFTMAPAIENNVKTIAIKVGVGLVVAVGIWQGVKFFKKSKGNNA